jgi:hypothetical protein
MIRDRNPLKSSVQPLKRRKQMAIHPNPDRDVKYMREMWGTTSLITDYWSNPKRKTTPKKHDFVHQNKLHEKIRNDNDYDDWEYGTEPLYGPR